MKNVTSNNSKPNTSKRALGREYAFKFIYKHLLSDFSDEKHNILNDSKALEAALNLFDQTFHEEDIEHTDNKIDMNAKVFGKELILGSLQAELKNSKIIEPYLSNQNLEKVDRMNLAVLLLGVYEILSDKNTSAGIFINEYVNIAKKYCPNDAQGFINSILDKVAKDHR